MQEVFTGNDRVSDLEQRLLQRRAAESLHRRGRGARGHGDFLLRHDRFVGPVLGAVLRAARLYARGVENALRPIVRSLRFAFPHLPPHLDGFRILHLSDLHIDGMDGLAEVISALIRTVRTDLCVMTGDYRYEVEGPYDAVYPRMRTILSAVSTPCPVLGILGNHDEADMALGLSELGVRMLINEAVEIVKGLWVAGIDDAHYYGCDNLSAALDDAPSGALKLLLTHTPEIYIQAEAAGFDMYFCGHTHAGQICLPWVGPPLLNATCPRAYARGRWQHGKMQGYTTAGTGCSLLPVRYNCPPEIATIELVRGNSTA